MNLYVVRLCRIVLLIGGVSFSGVNDYDYPSLSSPSVGLAGMELISTIKRIPLPAELVEQFDRILNLFQLWCLNDMFLALLFYSDTSCDLRLCHSCVNQRWIGW